MSRIFEALQKIQSQQTPVVSGAETIPPEPVPFWTEQREEELRPTSSFAPSEPPPRPSLTSFAPGLNTLRQRCAKPAWKLHKDSLVLFNEQSFDRCAEQFRILRARLYRLREKKPFRTLLVTSAQAGEGKSFVSLNLARAIVHQHERHALLIDADLRAPKLHVSLGAPSSPGLSDYLRGDADEFSIIQSGTGENLFFIPAGRPVSNPTELLGSTRAKSLFERLNTLFDWVIVDTSPVLPVSDATVLAPMCDGVILVVGAGRTSSDLARTACQELRESRLLGVVLNGVEDDALGSPYAYYGRSEHLRS